MNEKTTYVIEMRISESWWTVLELDGLTRAINAFRESVLGNPAYDYRLTTKTVS